MTHLLPGGGVPRVHRARSPVPPRLPHFATPRLVRYLAAVAAGAYPLRRPPDVWSPGAPAPPGPCYWLVASGTPVGWRGGCLALGLVRGAARHYCLGGCSALVVCARRSQPVRGAWAGAWCPVFPVCPFPPRVPHAVCDGPSRPGVPYPRSLVRHSMRSVRSAGSVRLPFWYSPRALCVCVRSRSRGVRAPPPLPGCCGRAPRVVPVLAPGRAVQRGPCSSACPAPVLCPVWFAWGGGGGPVPYSPYLALGCVPPVGWICASGAFQRRRVGWGGGGGGCAPFSPTVRPGGPVGRGVALPQPVPLPSLGRQQSGCPWRRSGHGGRGPHTAPVRVRLLSLSSVRVAPLCATAGSLAHRGSCESRRRGRGGGPCSGLPPGRRGPGGRGDHLPASGGRGAGAPVACGTVGGGGTGGGRAVAPHLPPPGGGRLRLSALSPFRGRRIPPRRTRSVGVVGQPRAPGAARCRRASLAGGGGAHREPPPRRAGRRAGGPGGRCASARPSAFPGRATMRASSATLRLWGARPPYCSGLSSRAAPRSWSVRPSFALVWVRLPVATPAGAGGRGCRGARRAGPAAPPPGRCGPSWGRGDTPSASGGWRASAPAARRPGGEWGGRGEGGAPPSPAPLFRRGGPWPSSLSPWAPPLGIHVQPG